MISSAATSGTTATISLSSVVMGTDDAGVAASSYSVSYSLNSGSAVTALSNQTGASASFQIADLADGSYTCAVTITTDKGKVASKSVSFTINTSLPPVPVGSWTSGPMSADGSSIRTDGTLVYAFAAQNSTVGGVSFVRDAPLGASGMVSASPAPDMGSGSWGDDGTTGDFAELLRNGWNWTGDGNELSYTLTLNGLTAGKTYLVQLIAHRQSNSMLVSANGSPTAHVHGSDESNCKYGASIVGVFVASGSSATVTVTYTNQTGDRPLNAIQVRDLGEGGGGGGDDPIDPDPATPVCSLTIPAKTGLQLQSVTTNGVAVAAVGGSYTIVSNTQVTVTFAAASGYEITGGNPVVFTLSGNKTFADGDYPTVQATSGGEDPIVPVEEGWTAVAMGATSASIRTDGTLKYAYAAGNYTVNGVVFTASSGLINNADCVVWENTGGAQAFGSSAPSDTESGGYKSLLENGWWANEKARKIALNNLESGKRYLVQIIGFRQNYTTQTATAPDGTQTIKFDGDGWEYGGSLVGVFTASGTSQEFTITYAGQSCINAVQVRELSADAPVEPDAPVIGGEGVDVPFAVSSDKVAITISNAASGLTYGYKKSATLAGLKDASVVWFDDPADSDGVLTLEIPKVASEPSCFYQIVVE